MASSTVLSTLQHVTDTKLGKLSHRQRAFESEKKALLEKAANAPTPADRALVLVEDAIKRQVPDGALGCPPKTIKHFLHQAKHDPTVSEHTIRAWDERLKHALACQSRRYELTSLFSSLVSEWIQNPNEGNQTARSDSPSGDFEPVGREEMHQQRKEWESYAFTARSTDGDAIRNYLDGLFVTARKSRRLAAKTPLSQLRDTLKDFKVPRMTTSGVATAIGALLKADLFSGEKHKVLQSLKPMTSLLSEIADVLNHELDFIDEWSWEGVPLRLEMRRQLNGKYRVFMDEEVYQAIFLQYVGSHWAAHLKQAFTSFFHSGAWLEVPRETMSRRDTQRRDYFFNDREISKRAQSLRDLRRRTFIDEFFLTQLLNSFGEGTRDYGAEDDSDDFESLGLEGDRKTPGSIKQSILRQVATEGLVNTKLFGEFTVLQSDFKWFGPSLPHSTVDHVLRYFGVSDKWAKFFTKFLKAPLAFAQDGADAVVHVRECGIPMSHTLSDALGEAVLFPLDFAVNQRTGGSNLYRFHDDLWAWGSRERCEKAWAAMTEFSSIMGLELNLDKTGAVTMYDEDSSSAKKTASRSLPKGQVTWGFLQLDAKTGRWVIDQAQVDEHIKEFRRQLAACHSIMARVSCYNAYVGRFLLNNFGKGAECLGRPHIEDVTKTIVRVHETVFPETHGNVAAYLRRLIQERFGRGGDLPDGFFYFPQSIGGLGVQNPLVALQLHSSAAKRDVPGECIEQALDHEEVEYDRLREAFEKRGGQGHIARPECVSEDEEFMPLDEYMRFLELRSPQLCNAVEKLMEDLGSQNLDMSAEMGELWRRFPTTSQSNQSARAAMELYGHGVLDYCGDILLGEKELLPTGLLEMLQSEKFRWQG